MLLWRDYFWKNQGWIEKMFTYDELEQQMMKTFAELRL
jgi:hypothetical protein